MLKPDRTRLSSGTSTPRRECDPIAAWRQYARAPTWKNCCNAGLARYGQMKLVGTEVVGREPGRHALGGEEHRRGRRAVELDQRGEYPVAIHDLNRS